LELKGRKVGVIMGGTSSEREVSLRSGWAVLKALRKKGIEAIPLEVGEDLVQQVISSGIEVAFVALHGKGGEDGTVQGLLELLRIPYTGSGVLASALAMNKVKAKKIFAACSIPTPESVLWRQGVAIPFPPPWVVKPASQGSTIGLSVVREESQLQEAVSEALRYDQEVFIERFVPGKELTVALLDGRTLEVIEIAPKEGIYDYRAKYTPGMTEYLIPAPISPEARSQAQKLAQRAYEALGCSGCARVDMRMDSGGRIWVLEVNTIPGMTATSLVPKAAAYEGMSFEDLVLEILKGASLKGG